MRILRIYPFLPPLQGGMEKHVLRLTEEQRKLGCEVTLAFNQGNASSPSDILVLQRVNLRKIKPQFLRDLFFYGALLVQLLRKRGHFDVVHVHGDWSSFLLGRIAAAFVRAPKRVASIHGVARRGIWSRVYGLVLDGYTLVYATGFSEANYVKPLVERPVHWQHSGIDEDFVFLSKELEQEFDVISVGSFVEVKNFEFVVQIASLMPECRFLLVGDGPLRSRIEADCQRRGFSNVVFAGQVKPAKVASLLRKARIFLLTSRTEGTPTAILEAMACGLAIVTSHSNNFDELIKPGMNGFVIEGFRVEEYIAKIRELLDDVNLLKLISRRNSEQAKYYSWPAVAKRVTEWMQSDAVADS